MNLHAMVGLDENDQQAYSSLPNQHSERDKPTITGELNNIGHRVPLTTKHEHGQKALESSATGILSQDIDNIREPSQFTHAEPEERLPKFKIDLQELRYRNLSQRPIVNNLTSDESNGIGLMLSMR